MPRFRLESPPVHNLLFWAHTLCMNYVSNTFLLVSSLVRSKQLLCFVHGQQEQKHTTKKFVCFPSINYDQINFWFLPKGIFLFCFHKLSVHIQVHKTTFEGNCSLE